MTGLALGLCCGIVEFLLLQKLVKSITNGSNIPLWVIPAKMAALVVFFVPCGFFFAKELPYAGIGTAGVLIVGSFIKFIIQTRGAKKRADGAGEKNA